MAKKKILYIEDNKIMRMVLKSILSRDYDVEEASTLQEVTRKVVPHVDIIVADLNLPDSEGRETVSRLTEAYFGVPIIVMSADKGMRKELSREKQVVAFVYKPDVEPSEFRHMLHRILEET